MTRPLRFDESQEHPGLGLTPQRVLHIFRAAEAGYTPRQCDLFDDLVENDGHLRDLLDHRCQVVAGKPMVIPCPARPARTRRAAPRAAPR